jgi:hypothetical protein
VITDSPAGRNPATALRDLLRSLDREATAAHPARPSAPPALLLARAAPAPVTVGDWVLSQDPDTGDLVATHGITGATATVALNGGV